ncbi:MAG TPA: nuclear transport factor 2 family protein [Bacteroidales bacterium]|nr:nuclear transport factor 2 family protein [Bacteroidales bacterium]HOH83330.1 nuclear transport factor 2 family protein [Bacteroidales bacterium]HPB24446.1 nuclear transport factor 2 family protein [Bacteroidales bacterium]
MKSTKVLSALLTAMVVFMLTSCCDNNKCKKQETLVSPDSLIGKFATAWNQKDTNAVADIFSDNALFLYRNYSLKGKDSIMIKWVNPTIFNMANLKLTNIASGASADMAFITGFYTFDLTQNDSVVASTDGNYTSVWKKQSDSLWTMELMHQGDLRPE